MQRLSNKEQICDVREARFAASVRPCKEGGQKVAVIYSSVSQLDGGIAQLVERLVRNENRSIALTLSHALLRALS